MKPLMSPLSALALVGLVAVSVVQAGVEYADPAGGWDYTYDGAGDAFGTGGYTALDGTWTHDSADDWDGSKPGAGPLSPPDSPVPGGIGSFPEAAPEYLRIQDTGKPKDWGWNTDAGENKKFYLGHLITADPGNGDATSVLANGMTFSLRVRLASDGPLDAIYPEDPPDPLPTPEP